MTTFLKNRTVFSYLFVVNGLLSVQYSRSSSCDEKKDAKNSKLYSSFVNGPFPRSRESTSPVTWNDNWDFRHYDTSNQKVLPHFSQKDQQRTKGIHQIVLVRHGQYHNTHEFDYDHVLTDLGKAQATLTGKRLNELIEAGIVYKINNIFYSTMKRATETWEAIQTELTKNNYLPKDHHIQACSMIREGAVCPPVPPSILWTPTEEVFLKDQQRVSVCCLVVLSSPFFISRQKQHL
jgi:hypothetical protein